MSKIDPGPVAALLPPETRSALEYAAVALSKPPSWLHEAHESWRFRTEERGALTSLDWRGAALKGDYADVETSSQIWPPAGFADWT